MRSKPIATTIRAKLPKREGQFTFSRTAVARAWEGKLVVELTEEASHVVRIAFKGSDLKLRSAGDCSWVFEPFASGRLRRHRRGAEPLSPQPRLEDAEGPAVTMLSVTCYQ
jgi:hypothetical protein